MNRNTKRQSKILSEGPPGQSPAERPVAEASDAGAALRPWLLAAVCALFVARPLFPSESATTCGGGLAMVMLWIVLLGIWLLGAIGRPKFRLRFGWTDVAVGLLILLHTVAAIRGAMRGSPRPAVNMLWEWMAYGISFFLVRQLVAGKKEIRAVMAGMVALAVALGVYGLYQYGYEMPATRREYQQDPDGMLERAGMWFEKNSPGRRLFENRLESREPLATFALTNSLAGYLSPWLIVSLGIAMAGLAVGTAAHGSKRTRLWAARIGFSLGVLAIAACFLLTKSRSGYLAAMLGAILVALFCRNKVLRIGWKIPTAVVAVVGALVIGGVMVRGLDAEILSEATKSFGYRLQYWQSALHMIGDRPWLGCGPGNFQADYTLYKLPEASEEVADPHNFLLEVWATAGTPAMLALVAVLVMFAVAVMRRDRVAPGDSLAKESLSDADRHADQSVFVLAGVFLGFLVAVPVGLMSEAPPGWAVFLCGVPGAALMLAVLYPWVQSGRLPALLPAIGIVVLLVNLLAAGGIGFPGVAGTLWLLLALGLNDAERRGSWELPRRASVAGLVLTLALGFACYQTAYRPVLESQAAMRAAVRDPGRAVPLLADAIQADPLWADPWAHLAQTAFAQWQKTRSTQSLEQFTRSMDAGLRLSPNSSSLWLTAGQRFSQVFSAAGQPEFAQKAVNCHRRAVELYPNSAVSRAWLALAMKDAGDEAGFEREATLALELDTLTPHLDKKLDDKLRTRLLRKEVLGTKVPGDKVPGDKVPKDN